MKKVFIIGGMKCGTSSLYQMFKSNDAICLSKFKEPSFFSKRPMNGLEWYKNQFDPTANTKYLMDVSPSYSKIHLFPDCAKMMHEYAPDGKIIYIVRDPFERIISNIHHDILRGRVSITKGFLSNENYIKTSCYQYQINPYIELFGQENILILQFEDLKDNLNILNTKLSNFLEIASTVTSIEAQNISEKRYLIKYYDFVHRSFGNGFITKLYHYFWKFLNIKVKKPDLSAEEMQSIYETIEKDVQTFIKNYQIDTKNWKIWNNMNTKN